MGVPAFFRWLSRKYVSIIVDAIEEWSENEEGVRIPVDCTQPNPNYQEFDNLYLDLNGIIHSCTHPDDRPAPKTEKEMFALIFGNIDRLFSIVRPRKLLYMAIDGVAPRAKMNQQRSRRFRASKEAADKREQIATIRKRLEDEGIPLPPARKEEEHFDSNCITPGTPFMARLSDALRYYIHMRITNDPAWKKIQVIFSDASVPGEGEHKIIDFIRHQRLSSSYDPKTVHCLCSADADLIMLGLATHESNFNILREEFVPNQKEKNFIFIRLPVLRGYLERELTMPNLPFPYDLERAIDDWVMMCFFVGNDFLPHLPSLEIREGAIDRLVKLYKQMVYQTGGWLTEDGEVNIERVTMIMTELGKAEDEIFKERQIYEQKFKESQKQQKRRASNNASLASDDQRAPTPANKNDSSVSIGSKRKADTAIDASPNGEPPAKSFKEEKVDQEDQINLDEGPPKSKPAIMVTTPSGKQTPLARGMVAALVGAEDESDEEPEDGIRFWEAGWKDRYYQAKFQVSESDQEFRRKVACAYVEGIAWMFHYYRKGCASWTWYYPFHYAPFASDFELVGNFKPDFSKSTKPFKPLEQMMGVFPPASRSHIPAGWRSLMTDPNSPIIDFYPLHFEIDMSGKKYASQGIALLPFVDEKRLLDALALVYDTLTPEEQSRNMTGPNRLFVGKQHTLFEFVHKVHMQGKRNGRMVLAVNNTNRMENSDESKSSEMMEHWTPIDAHKAFGMSGEICHDKKAMECGISYVFMFQNSHFGELKNNQCIMVRYRNPHAPQESPTDQETEKENKETPHLMKPRGQANIITAEKNNPLATIKCDNTSLATQISLQSFSH